MVTRGGSGQTDSCGRDHTSDVFRSRDRAQFLHPDLAEPLLEAPLTHKKSDSFVHDPHHYHIDFLEQPEQAVTAANGGMWFHVCFPDEDPSEEEESAEPHSYHSPFPRQPLSFPR